MLLVLRVTVRPLTLKFASAAVCKWLVKPTSATALPLPSSLPRVNDWVAPVSPVSTTLKPLPVLISCAVTPKSAPLMALTMPAGVAVVTAIGSWLTPPSVRFRVKALPPLRGVLRSAKLPLAVRWAWAVCKTSMP